MATSLSVNHTLSDYGGSFSLIIDRDSVFKVNIFDDVTIKNALTGKKITAGIIEKISYEYMVTGTMIAHITLASYKVLATKKYAIDKITSIADFSSTNETDGRTTGLLAWSIIKHYLSSYGVTRGYVVLGNFLTDDNEQIDDNKLELKTVYDIVTRIANATGGYTWTIDMDKQFNFFGQKFVDDMVKTHSVPIKAGGRWRDISVDIDAIDYQNYIYVIGGQNEDDNGLKTPTTNQIYTIVKNQGEIDDLAMITGDGQMEGVYYTTNTTTRDALNAIAADINGSYGRKPYTLSFTSSTMDYNAGDYIYADLPMFFDGILKFAVDSITIRDMGAQVLEYDYVCTHRDNNAPHLTLAELLVKKDMLGLDLAPKPKSATLLAHYDFTDFDKWRNTIIGGVVYHTFFDARESNIDVVSYPTASSSTIIYDNGISFADMPSFLSLSGSLHGGTIIYVYYSNSENRVVVSSAMDMGYISYFGYNPENMVESFPIASDALLLEIKIFDEILEFERLELEKSEMIKRHKT